MAEEKSEGLFRKKSIEYINSPEKMDEYLRVTSPGVWAFLLAVIVLLVGMILWGIFGRMETYVPAAILVDQGECVCLVPADALDVVIANRTVEMDGENLPLAPDKVEPVTVTDKMNVYVLLAGELETGDIVYEIQVNASLEDGIYQGRIKTESISPISLLLN